MSFSNFIENELLDAALANGSYVTANLHMSLHTADPGETGASEVSGGSYARQPTAYNAASGGSAALTATESFTNMPAATVTHFGLWDALTAGNFIAGGALASSKVVGSGDTLNITSATVSLD